MSGDETSIIVITYLDLISCPQVAEGGKGTKISF